ncbi:zinc finger protein 846-like [Mercenaria mercenaria]|uniref:zinc finger protein 846-like n=1 Tax=Mercenaria mercenaria TaxID=6596 RepID=UPI00234F3CAB|nr:zinc finger protein 846-like [Mercenaria mercenaria]XP_045208137.2 zinc finger protein 846-like [Mercenaria mercenaria]
MENFHSHLSNVPFAEDCEKTSPVSERRESIRSANIAEPDILVSDRSPSFSTLPIYHSGGFPYSSVNPSVFPQGSSVRYSGKSLGQCLNTFREVGVDMTNRSVPVNTNVRNPIGGFDSRTKFNDNGLQISEPTTGSDQSGYSSSKHLEGSLSGDIKIQNHGNIVINMSVAEKTEGARYNSLSAGLHTVNTSRSCVNCVEETNVSSMFSCGGCKQKFYTICKLHTHIKTHNQDGSYYYSQSNKTAYPKFDTCCIATQTEDNKKDGKHSKHKEESVESFPSGRDGEVTVRSKKVEDNFMTSMIDSVNETLTNEDDSEIKLEKGDPEYIPDSNMDRSGSDTDEYKPEDSIYQSPKKRRKGCSKKRNERNRVKMKGSKKLKKLKMTIKIKQEERKDKRSSFLKKDRKPNSSSKIKVQIKKLDDKIACKLCDESFSKKLYLRHHIKAKHSDVEHLCQLCGDHFTTDDELIEHRRTVHNRGYHRCELCDKVLSTKGMLEGHYLVHKGIKPFACDVCVPKKEFTRKCQLKAHMETHSTEKTLQCEFCGKPFSARYLMLSHVKHCGGIKPHKCDYCDMSFVSNHCLQRHRRTHTGEKPFVCEVCAFASSNASCLARHLRTHTGEKPFTCQYCQQTFAARGALKKHVRIHTQEKPYKCRYCTKAFTQNWNLKTHERQHTGETPYKCHVCGIGYKQNVLLKTHLRTHFGPNSDSSETQNLALNQSVSHCQTENQTSVHNSVHNQSLVSLQSGSKSDNLKHEFSQSQSVNSQPQLIDLHTQPIVPNILLSSFLHSGYSMN